VKQRRAEMAKTTRATASKVAQDAAPKAGFAGFEDSDGSVGFKPWKDGQYAVEIQEAERRREPDDPTGYVAVYRGEILPGGAPEQPDERDPEGMSLWFSFWIPHPEDPNNGQYFERFVDAYKNFCNAFGVKIVGSWFASKKEEQEFVSKTGVAVMKTRMNKKTKENEQRAARFLDMDSPQSVYRTEEEE